jgi:hypothetical protein
VSGGGAQGNQSFTGPPGKDKYSHLGELTKINHNYNKY